MRALTFSSGLSGDPQIAAILQCPVIRVSPFTRVLPDDVVIIWGVKDKHKKALAFAQRHSLPVWTLEDGLIGYLGHPAISKQRLSLIVDTSGLFYDSTRPSDLENMLATATFSQSELDQAQQLIDAIKRWRISKYNHAPINVPDSLLGADRSIVLVIDQTFGDRSIPLAGASPSAFAVMLQTALDEHPDADIWVKVHPDALVGKKRGHFETTAPPPRVRFVAEDITPQALFERVDHVYVVSSQMGFEALIAGKPVTCFGMPFYAGWGLTDDRQTLHRRRRKLTLKELVAAALLRYPRYYDPFLQRPADIWQVVDYFEEMRQRTRPAKPLIALGFSLWKRGFVDLFSGGVPIKFRRQPRAAGDDLLVWGRKSDPQLSAHKGDIWRLEDGFIRSVGLGSDLQRPASLALDGRGIYYDGSAPSDLEYILEHMQLSERACARAQRLIDAILGARLSKYNVGAQDDLDFRARAAGRAVILVPGQVEDDASIRYGSANLKSNLALLKAVRAAQPDAYIVFKPHPDLVAGNRAPDGGRDYLDFADQMVVKANIIDCLEQVDAVHTMTSLTGFEALLRGLDVTCYGSPFYAGWGLTTDICPHPRRTVRRTLAELVYAALIVYPVYVDWHRSAPSVAEVIVEKISKSVASGLAKPTGSQYLMRQIRKISFLLRAALR